MIIHPFFLVLFAAQLFLTALFLHDMPEHQRTVRWLTRISGMLIVLALTTWAIGVIR